MLCMLCFNFGDIRVYVQAASTICDSSVTAIKIDKRRGLQTGIAVQQLQVPHTFVDGHTE